MWSRLGISFDQFIRTTEPAHKSGVRALIKRVHASSPDDLYEKTYEGWYCVGCELFKRENEIADGKCVLHPTRDLLWTQERWDQLKEVIDEETASQECEPSQSSSYYHTVGAVALDRYRLKGSART